MKISFKTNIYPSAITSGLLPTRGLCTYVLKLESGNYYVGKSSNLKHRLDSHFDYKGSSFTHLHAPIKLLAYWIGDFEKEITLQFMKEFGIEHVRGYCWSASNLKDLLKRTPYLDSIVLNTVVWDVLKPILKRVSI